MAFEIHIVHCLLYTKEEEESSLHIVLNIQTQDTSYANIREFKSLSEDKVASDSLKTMNMLHELLNVKRISYRIRSI